jgi:predicted nucleic acid-binding protein
MLSIYLDTNIYIFGLLDGKSGSAVVLREVLKRDIMVVQSDYLFDEVLHWFREHKGKDSVGLVRTYLLTLPCREFVNKAEWSYFLLKVKDDVADRDDLPHICSYFAGGAEYFVTTNRRLTQMKIRGKVNFLSPEEFLRVIGGSDDTVSKDE